MCQIWYNTRFFFKAGLVYLNFEIKADTILQVPLKPSCYMNQLTNIHIVEMFKFKDSIH